MPGAGDLYAAAVELLSATATALEGTPAGPIGYQAVWPGLPAYDCVPALYVHAGGTSIGNTLPLQPTLQPMQREVVTGVVRLISFTITVLRCAPSIEENGQNILMPSAAEVSQAAADTYGDVWAIWNYLAYAHRPVADGGLGTLFQTPSGRREFEFRDAIPIVSSGGAAGWEIPIGVQLGGYNPGASS